MLTASFKKQLDYYLLDIDLNVDNELVVLFGRSGAGKTTILQLLAGLSKPADGWIKLNERTLYHQGTIHHPTQRRNIGYVFQDYALFPHMTVKKNIQYGIRDENTAESRSHINKLVDMVSIGHLQKKYPHEISGGEKQRVALVRALAYRPDLLLMDEPFSALDEESRYQCHEQVLQLKEKWQIPMILVTHNREEAEKLADRILFIENGKIVDTN
ncbi:molybdate transport system ATP-binding protein [Thalassobacillus pellis]|nr:ATP-binding cassette domain-containing protein [Thalassobacillus pellis]MBM7551127.1 molybdate transport system ATP-binding protein [Thalassobacillus pellis]